MEKKLYLLPKEQLSEFLSASKELLALAKGMSADDIKANSEYILQSAGVYEVIDGNAEYTIQDGIARIPISGMLTNSVDPCAAFFGESITTYDYLIAATENADNNPNVKEIIYEVASGGGDVDGVEAASNVIFNAKKKTTARVHSMAASAAYWLASQTDRIIATGRTSGAGSIGVAAEFIDRSAEDKANGRERIILTSTDAPQKRLDIRTEEAQKIVIERMDDIHDVFVDHILRGRAKAGQKLTRQYINDNFGRGSTMASEKALAVKMIDAIEDGANGSARDTEPVNSGKPTTKGQSMNREQFLTFLGSNPEALAFFNEIEAKHGADLETLKTDHERAIEDARAEVETGKLTKEQIKNVGAIISSNAYGQSIKNAGIKVLYGEKEFGNFEDLVALADENNEKMKSIQTQQNQPDKTPAVDNVDDKSIKKAEVNASAKKIGKRFKGGE